MSLRVSTYLSQLVRSAADQEKSSAAALEMREEKRDEKRAARRKKREEKRNKGDKDDKDDGGPLAGNELAHDGKGADDDTVEIDLEARNGDDKEDKDADKEAGKESVWFFHLVMALGAVYLAMLITIIFAGTATGPRRPTSRRLYPSSCALLPDTHTALNHLSATQSIVL